MTTQGRFWARRAEGGNTRIHFYTKPKEESKLKPQTGCGLKVIWDATIGYHGYTWSPAFMPGPGDPICTICKQLNDNGSA